MHPTVRHIYQFGPFRLDTTDRILFRDGEHVPLAPKAIETLAVLVGHGGRIVDKEELLRQVWPDTFVEEVSLAKNISMLRKTLCEDGGHRYIETIPKRGYRFVAEVREVEQETESRPPAAADAAQSAAVGDKEPERRELPPVPAGAPAAYKRAAVLLVLIGAAAAIAALMIFYRPSNPGMPLTRAVPLTSYPGREEQAAFSPDGNQIAFTWREEEDRSRHIYVKLIEAETPLRLTNTAADDSKPVWSPDGRSIVFLRTSAEGGAYYTIPALGGAERRLIDISRYFDHGSGNSPYYSPDGKYLAIVDRDSPSGPFGIFLLSMANLERRKLTFPPAGDTGDYYPAFSPDGRTLAFARSSSFSTTDLYALHLATGALKRLTFDGLTILGLAWTHDSREIIFSSRRGGSISYLWRISASGGRPERVSVIGGEVSSPALSARGSRLAYTQSVDDMNIWRFPLDPAGHANAAAPAIASTFWDADPDYSPDGSKIAFSSGRSGGFGIWICDAGGANPRLLFDGGPYLTGTPRWSPDGRWIAFDSRANDPGTRANPDIYVIRAEGGPVRRLTTDPAEDVAPSWSQDGRWIYFASTRSGASEVWKVPSDGGTAVQVTRLGGFEAFESPDGKYVYYLKGRAVPGIWRVPVEGREESLVTDRDQAGLWRYWRVTGRGIFYATAAAPVGGRIEFFDFATGQTREISRMTRQPDVNVPGLAICPDARYLLYAQKDQSGSDIMMVEDFR